MTDRLMSVAEVAAILGVKPKSLRNNLWARAHGLPGQPVPPFSRLGRRLVCRASDLSRWLDETLEPIESENPVPDAR